MRGRGHRMRLPPTRISVPKGGDPGEPLLSPLLPLYAHAEERPRHDTGRKGTTSTQRHTLPPPGTHGLWPLVMATHAGWPM